MEASAKCTSTGPAHCRERVQDSVRVASTSVQRSISHSGGPRAGSGNGTRSRYSFLQPLLHRSEEGWGVASYSRFEIIELFSHETQVQDAYYQGVTNQVWGLVCDDRSERRLLLYIHSFSTLEVPKICFRRQSIPISGSSVRSSTLTPHFHEVCGCCSGSPATLGHLQTELHWRLVDSSSIRAVSSSALRCCSCSHERHVMTFGLLHIRPCGSAPQAFPRGATHFAWSRLWALDTCVHRAALWRKSDKLFLCYDPYKKALPANKQTLSR